ncbi:MAG TPA: CPBP family intramembrane glutamic endopeptidase [Candidatus Acidoferrum sp.]|nr:CPBP family intramembrane glutamic endopeptidase [Candidatus Acidoferrum sp.]
MTDNRTVEKYSKLIEKHTIPQTILLHLLPGIPVLLVAILFSSPAGGFGLPFVLSLFIAIAAGLIPCEALLLFIAAKRRGAKIREMLCYTEKMPPLQTFGWVFSLLSINGFAFATIPQLERPLWAVFSRVPDWALIDIEAVKARPELIWPSLILGFLLNGFLGPALEEIYFRGYLLPRMGRFGKFAPLANTVLFSLYHLFSPWEFFTRVAAVLPYAYAVWYKKDLRLGILAHCLGNVLGLIGTAAALLS